MGSVSRRSFVELALGSLVSLPALAGGLIVAPAIALAENNPDVTASTGEPEIRNYAIIDIVRPWEVGFIARDVTRVIHTQTDDEENDRVQGTAHVVVTSRANRKSVSVQWNKMLKTAQTMSDKTNADARGSRNRNTLVQQRPHAREYASGGRSRVR